MNAPPLDGLIHLVSSCRQSSERYKGAARAVGDPGLRLQFKHVAASRAEMEAALSAAAGVAEVIQAEATEPAPATGVFAAASTSGICRRSVLGGEDHARPLGKAALCSLAQTLRHHDESMLNAVQHMRTQASADIASVLDRMMETLLADLKRIRILEDMTRDLDESVDPH